MMDNPILSVIRAKHSAELFAMLVQSRNQQALPKEGAITKPTKPTEGSDE